MRETREERRTGSASVRLPKLPHGFTYYVTVYIMSESCWAAPRVDWPPGRQSWQQRTKIAVALIRTQGVPAFTPASLHKLAVT
jgi:hypothetical protein